MEKLVLCRLYKRLIIGELCNKHLWADDRSNQMDSVSAVPAFPGLRQFPDGWDFSQWTGDDSKAFMKVELLLDCPWAGPEALGLRANPDRPLD